jgi:hypothetical protein
MFEKVDDSEMQKLSAELDSMSKALDDMTFVAVKPCCLHAQDELRKSFSRTVPYDPDIKIRPQIFKDFPSFDYAMIHALSNMSLLPSDDFDSLTENSDKPYVTPKKYTTNKQFFESFGGELSAHKDCEQLCVIEKQKECDSLNWKLDDCYDD